MLTDRKNYENWSSSGAEDTVSRAMRIWKQLLKDYRQPPLDPAIDEALSDYVARRKSGMPAGQDQSLPAFER